MGRRICIVTGGAGFIGCALSKELVKQFDKVIAVDILHPQIHEKKERPALLDEKEELIVADICESRTWDELLADIEAIDTLIHLAAETGTAQSMTETTRHAYTNVVGTTCLLDALERFKLYPRQILLTSSRAVYGEGAWEEDSGKIFYPGQRSVQQLSCKQWDFVHAHFLPVSAQHTWPHPTSVYGVTKLAQEQIIASWCLARAVNYKIVRLQNVYGPGQSLINPYTGIVSLFVRLSKKGESIPLYEDGEIIRDFIFIDDVKRAIIMALNSDKANGKTLDIGTGKHTTIAQMAKIIAHKYAAPMPHVCGKYRNGDVRHAVCDPEITFRTVGFKAQYQLEEGINRLCEWIDIELQKG